MRLPNLFLRLALLAAFALLWGVAGPARATDLPTGVLEYLRLKDPQVQVRFDGLVTFANGTSYLPVLPQGQALNVQAAQVIRQEPAKSDYPDLIQFDNHLFLLKLVETASGKLALARVEPYPIELKEGLLPQDLVLPANLFIPTELKVILGDLPYNPPENPVATAPVSKPQPKKPVSTGTAAVRGPVLVYSQAMPAAPSQTLYLSNLGSQSIVALDPALGKKKEEIAINCVPASLVAAPDGKHLYANCLSSDELLIIDTQSNLVKARVPVGKRPGDLAIVGDEVIVSNHFSDFLSVVRTSDAVAGPPIRLPDGARGGVMTLAEPIKRLFVADATAGKVYVFDTETRKLAATFQALPNVSALWADTRNPAQPALWLASRSAHQLVKIDVATGGILKVLDVGRKPLALVPAEGALLVLCANDDRIEVVDLAAMALLNPIPLSPGSFPTGATVSVRDGRAYISTAGANAVYVINLKNRALEKTIPVEARGIAIT